MLIIRARAKQRKADPLDWRDPLLYMVMLDRFGDGDPSSNVLWLSPLIRNPDMSSASDCQVTEDWGKLISARRTRWRGPCRSC